MDTATIQKHIDKMPAAMSAKGLYLPEARFSLEANASCVVMLSWYKSVEAKNQFNRSFEWFRKGTIAQQIFAAGKFIAALPSKEETNFREFMGALGGVIDLGKKNGIEVEFMNPLVATMKKLSENALTDQRAA